MACNSPCEGRFRSKVKTPVPLRRDQRAAQLFESAPLPLHPRLNGLRVGSMSAQSLPVIPPQPNVSDYGITYLYLFKTYNSAETFQAAFGVAAPSLDLTRLQKTWFDTSVDLTDPEADVTYTVVRQPVPGGQWVVTTRTMMASEAATVNVTSGAATTDPVMLAWLAKPSREIPIRALLPNESLKGEPPFNLPMITRSDLLAQEQAANGGFTGSDRALLKLIAQALKVG